MNTNVSKTTIDQLTENEDGVKTVSRNPPILLIPGRPISFYKFLWSPENSTISDENQFCKLVDNYTGGCLISTLYDAFDELITLGIIRSVIFNSKSLDIDCNRLFTLGYIIVFNMCKQSPVFVKCQQLSYMYDIRPYMSHIVPFTVLESYCLIKIKQGGSKK